MVSLYVPTPHDAQDPLSGPVCPTMQTQEMRAVLASDEALLAGQEVRSAASASVLYIPAPHTQKEPPSCTVYPELQTQSMRAVLACQRDMRCNHPDLAQPCMSPCHTPHKTPPLSGQVCPTLQTQSMRAVLALGEVMLTGQEVHLAASA